MQVSVAICYSPGLGFDLDISDDLETFQHMEPGLIERLVGHPDDGERWIFGDTRLGEFLP
jgi:hypothetical protein